MKCPRCQHEIPLHAKFCLECGARLAPVCVKCQTELPTGAKFCLECGEPVAARAPASRFSAPETYTPKYLAEKILTSKAALEGERKQVTVLFADLKGSMELLADRDPEDARKLVDPVLTLMMDAVHHYEGTVNQVMGDGIMALFGAPLAHEDHAVRACYAALRMQEAARRYSDELRRGQGVEVQIRVGVNSGDVVVRSVGSDLRMDYTAVGQTTHLAARLEQMAMPGSILISPNTRNLGEGYVLVKALGTRPVKGLAAPVEVFEVLGAGTVRSRLQAAAVHGLTRFVGRDPESGQLRQAMDRAAAGHGQVVAVIGEPGVGKSRLFWEFTHSGRSAGWLTVESVSVSYGKAKAFLPLIELLRTYFQIEVGDDAGRTCEKVTGKLLSLDRALEHSLPALLWILEVPVEAPQWQRLDPPQRRMQMLDAIKRLLLRESQVQPLLIVFEDLHWIDAETQAFLDSFVESLPSARVLLLVNFRPEYRHGWGSKTYYRQLQINPLPLESADELLDELLGSNAALAPLKCLLIERTEGNPFFLEESVRTLVETGVLAGDPGGYRLAKATLTLQIPATAQAILAARIDRLEQEDKRLLQAASVLGRDVPYTLLQAIAEGSEEALRRGLLNLQAAEFLYEAQLFPELKYTFKHALTHEVAYGSLLNERRRGLHAAAVAAIERLYADRLIEHVEQLADHAFRSEVWDKAHRYLREAGTKAAARSAHREAVSYFEQALVALGHVPQDQPTLEQGIDLRLELRNAFGALGEHAGMHDVLREAEALASSLGDSRRLGQISAHLAFYFVFTGQAQKGVAAGQRALAVASELVDLPLNVLASVRLAQAYFALGEYQLALETLSQNVEAVRGPLIFERFSLPFIASTYVQGTIAECLTLLGDFASAKTRAQKALEIAEMAGHEFSLISAYIAFGSVHLGRGEAQEALRWLARGLDRSREGKYPVGFAWAAREVGRAYTLTGRIEKALDILQQGISQASSLQLVGLGVGVGNLAYLGHAYLHAGKLADALSCSEQALELSRIHGQRGWEAEILRILGDIRSVEGLTHEGSAESLYHEAIAVAEPCGMRPLVAHCHFGLGKLYRRTGDREQAQEHLTIATALYQEMGMTYWPEQAAEEMRQLG